VNLAGSNFGKRLENEGSLVHARVGEGEAAGAHDAVAVENEVEVEGAGPVGNAMAAVATILKLDGEEPVEEGFRVEVGFQGYSGVEKGWLMGVADWSGGV